MAEMTKKEFLELLNEFSKKTLDPKIDQIDKGFEKIDQQFERIDSRFGEFREEVIHQFHIISEDVISKVQLVAEGVANLNEKLDRHADENRKDHMETVAAIKFSYAELDRRITNLEAEMGDLKRRIDKVERRSVS
jgi:phage shock protein A